LAEGISKPSLNDYMAGAMLANGFIWIWSMMMGHIPLLYRAPIIILANASYLIYLVAGFTSSYLVCLRAERRHLIVGLKTALLSWLLSILFMLSFSPKPDWGFSTALLICLIMGSVAGAYLALKRRIRRRRSRHPSQG